MLSGSSGMFGCYMQKQHKTLMMSITVVGAAQHDGWVHDNHLVHLSNYMGYVFVVHLITFGHLFTLRDSLECVLFAIYPHFYRLAIQQHWCLVQPQCYCHQWPI